MRTRALIFTAVVAACIAASGSVAGQGGATTSPGSEADPRTSGDAVVRGVLFFSPTCPHCELVIAERLPPIFETWGGGFDVSFDDALPADEVAFYLMGNDTLQLLMVDTSVEQGADVFVEDSLRLNIERAGVPRLDIADDYLVGSADIPTLLPGIIADGLASGGVDWPPVAGIDEALGYFDAAGLLAGSAAPVGDDEAGHDAGVLPGAGDRGPLERIGDDPVGNGVAIIVLVALLASLVAIPVLGLRGRLRSYAAWIVPLLVLVGLGVAAYLATIETSGSEAVCGPVGDCNAVQASEFATVLGVPIGLIGVLGYLALGGLWLVTRRGPDRLADWARVLLAVGAFGGLLFSAYLTFLEPFVIGATCLWCVSSALVMLGLAWVTAGDGWAAFDRSRPGGPDGGRRASAPAAAGH